MSSRVYDVCISFKTINKLSLLEISCSLQVSSSAIGRNGPVSKSDGEVFGALKAAKVMKT